MKSVNTKNTSRARHSQIAIAFRNGREAAKSASATTFHQVANIHATRDGAMPESLATVQGALWHAFLAGVERQIGRTRDAGISLRNSRFLMQRATALGRA